jgi:hypothetical protein
LDKRQQVQQINQKKTSLNEPSECHVKTISSELRDCHVVEVETGTIPEVASTVKTVVTLSVQFVMKEMTGVMATEEANKEMVIGVENVAMMTGDGNKDSMTNEMRNETNKER